jgi:hypothetical protein
MDSPSNAVKSKSGFKMSRIRLRHRHYGDPSTGEAEGRLQNSQDEVQQIGTVGAMPFVKNTSHQFKSSERPAVSTSN